MIKWHEQIVQKLGNATYKHIYEKLKGNSNKNNFSFKSLQLGKNGFKRQYLMLLREQRNGYTHTYMIVFLNAPTLSESNSALY